MPHFSCFFFSKSIHKSKQKSNMSEVKKSLRKEQSKPLTIEEKAEFGLNQSDSLEEEEISVQEPSEDEDDIQSSKKQITIGEYEVSLPQEKIPLLGLMGCAVVLHIAIFIDNTIYSSMYRYGIILSICSFFGATISLVIPSKKAMPINYFLYFVTYAGACFNTIGQGPFAKAGNGFFASWGLSICAAIAADPPGSLRRALFNSTLNLGAAALVVLLTLLPDLINGVPKEFEIETYITVGGCAFTLFLVMIMMTLKWCTWNQARSSCGESVFLTFLSVLWTFIACMVTFRGPFKEVGSGYFASWFGLVMAVKAAGLEWRNRVKVKKDGREG